MRILLIIILLVSYSFICHSQVEIGFKFGANTNNYIFSKKDTSLISTYKDIREFVSIHFGVTSNIRLNDKLLLKPEIFYVMKGFSARPSFSSLVLRNAAAISTLAEYSIIPKLNVYGGLEWSYVFNHALLDSSGIESVEFRFKGRREFDLGASIGFTFRFSKKWAADLRYNRSIVYDKETENKVFERTIYLSLHRYFGKKEK